MQAFFTFFQHLFCKKAHTAAPAFSPSIADDMIPPEYPAPSPHGKVKCRPSVRTSSPTDGTEETVAR